MIQACLGYLLQDQYKTKQSPNINTLNDSKYDKIQGLLLLLEYFAVTCTSFSTSISTELQVNQVKFLD